jgi:hypothetical protein
VNVHPLHTKSDEMAAYFIRTEVKQCVLMERDPSLRMCGATTWSTGNSGTGDIAFIRESVKGDIETFINAWLAVNRKE